MPRVALTKEVTMHPKPRTPAELPAMRRLLITVAAVFALAACGGNDAATPVSTTQYNAPKAPTDACIEQVTRTIRTAAALQQSGGVAALQKLNGQYLTDPVTNEIAARIVVSVSQFLGRPHIQAEVDDFWYRADFEAARSCNQAFPRKFG
jgi:hypothetical protein